METAAMRRLRGDPWACLLVLSLGFFMTLLDLTIVNIAIPNMVDQLGASLDQILWVVNAYVLALAVLLITAGRLGDLRGKKNLFNAGVVVFTLASLACALAQDPAQLIASRAVQGVGAALLIPQTLSIIVDVFPAKQRGVALGVWGAIAGLAGAAGPTVGGLLVTRFDWRWIFLVNVPVGLAVLVMGLAFLPETRRTVQHSLDITGVLLASASLFCLAFALIQGPRYDWNAWILTLIGTAVALLAIFLVYQRGQQDNDPLVPFALFKDRNFAVLNLVGMTVMFSLIGLLLPVTIYLQSVLGLSALKAGVAMVPLALGAMITAGPAGTLSQRLGGKYILMAGLSMFAAGALWIMTIADVDGSWTAVLAPLFLSGLGAGCTFAPMATELMRNVPPRLTGAASGVNNALRQVGAVLGTAVLGAVLQNQLTTAMRDQAEQRAEGLPAPYRDPFVAGFADAGKNGVEVGAHQGAQQLPQGVPQDIAQRIQDLSAQVFGHGFTDAMRPTMIVSAVVLLGGAAACVAVKGHRGPSAEPLGLPAPESELGPGPPSEPAATTPHGGPPQVATGDLGHE